MAIYDISQVGGLNGLGSNPWGGGLDPGPGLNGLAASRCGGCCGGLSGQTDMTQLTNLLLGLVLGLMAGRAAQNGANPGAAAGLTPAGLGAGNGVADPGAAGAGGNGLQAPAADPNATIPSGGASPDKNSVGQMLEAAARKYGIPPEILKAIAWKESGWKNSAVGDGGQSSGIMQIYKTAHPDYDVQRGRNDSAYNIDYGARFLASLYKKYGNWRTAVRAYNGSGPMAERYADSVMQMVQSQPWGR
ncbi:MAG: lytic transglycosylase domain-containing protein [Armatimonadetes bacterium]|nr:lytic transglycosylase domain-containing protein [Armatimonadota bacterium]